MAGLDGSELREGVAPGVGWYGGPLGGDREWENWNDPWRRGGVRNGEGEKEENTERLRKERGGHVRLK
jgi:hypothetical protein